MSGLQIRQYSAGASHFLVPFDWNHQQHIQKINVRIDCQIIACFASGLRRSTTLITHQLIQGSLRLYCTRIADKITFHCCAPSTRLLAKSKSLIYSSWAFVEAEYMHHSHKFESSAFGYMDNLSARERERGVEC